MVVPREKTRSIIKCFRCERYFDETSTLYFIMANKPGEISVKISFHKECFREIAGEEYLLEGY